MEASYACSLIVYICVVTIMSECRMLIEIRKISRETGSASSSIASIVNTQQPFAADTGLLSVSALRMLSQPLTASMQTLTKEKTKQRS